MSQDVFGNIDKFENMEQESKLMRTLRLPRNETDLSTLVKNASEVNFHSKSIISSSLNSMRDESPSLLLPHPDTVKHSSLNSLSKLGGSRFTLNHADSTSRLNLPRVLNLKKSLNEHRV